MSTYDDPFAADEFGLTEVESKEEKTDLEEELAAERGDGYVVELVTTVVVSYTGPWPENNASQVYRRNLSEDSVIDAIYQGVITVGSALPPKALSDEMMERMAFEYLQENQVFKEWEAVEITKSWLGDMEMVDCGTGEAIEGFKLERITSYESDGKPASDPFGTDHGAFTLPVGAGGDNLADLPANSQAWDSIISSISTDSYLGKAQVLRIAVSKAFAAEPSGTDEFA